MALVKDILCRVSDVSHTRQIEDKERNTSRVPKIDTKVAGLKRHRTFLVDVSGSSGRRRLAHNLPHRQIIRSGVVSVPLALP